MNRRMLLLVSFRKCGRAPSSFSLLAVLLAFICLQSACSTPRWATHRAGAFNPGWLAADSSFQGVAAWQYTTGGIIYVTPVFSQDGTVYFGSCDGKVYSLDPNGQLLHQFQTGGCIYGLVVTDKAVYATSADHKLYAFDLALNPQWQFVAGGAATSAPMLYGNRLFFAADDKKLYAVDINGNAQWAVGTGDTVASTSAAWVAPGARALVIFGSFDHNVYALDQDTGAVVWKFLTGDYIYATPAVDINNGRVLIGSADGVMHSINANDGGGIWDFPTNDFIMRAAVVQGGAVYFMTDGGSFYGLDKNKNLLPPFINNGVPNPGFTDSPASAPILNVSNSLFFSSGYHTFFLMDPNKHSITSLFSINALFIADPSFGPNGLVVAAGADGTIYAIH